ncbi:MAG: hypothetical protein KGL39_08010 [Patescibacteria group bacterium]|nr:hypothetical protein [Patescibacteria group bacterium]
MIGFGTGYFCDAIAARLLLGSALPANFPPLGVQIPTTTNYALWLGLSSTIPDVMGNNVTEPVGNGYGRQPLITSPNANAQFSRIAPGQHVNSAAVQFPSATGTWGMMQCLLVYDAQTSGNLLAVATETLLPMTVGLGTTSPFFPALSIRFGIRAGLISEYLADLVAAYLYMASGGFSQLTTYLALCNSVPVSSDDGASLVEVTGAGYARVSIPTWQRIQLGRFGNASALSLPQPSGLWGAPVGYGVLDSATINAGNLQWLGELASPSEAIGATTFPPSVAENAIQVGIGDEDLQIIGGIPAGSGLTGWF